MAGFGFVILTVIVSAAVAAGLYWSTGFQSNPQSVVLDSSEDDGPDTSGKKLMFTSCSYTKSSSNFLLRSVCAVDTFCDTLTMIAVWLATRLEWLL